MSEKDKIYRALQQHIDKYMPVGFPETKSGVDLNILKHFFTAKDAELALKLGPLPESLEEIYSRVNESGMPIEELEEKLDTLVMKGALMGGKLSKSEKGEKRYSLSQWAVGIFELQVDRLSKKFAIDAEKYMDEAFYKEWFKPGTPAQMRTIPVSGSIKVEHYVSTYDDVRNLMENVQGPFSVHNCVCKQSATLQDQPCKLTENVRT